MKVISCEKVRYTSWGQTVYRIGFENGSFRETVDPSQYGVKEIN